MVGCVETMGKGGGDMTAALGASHRCRFIGTKLSFAIAEPSLRVQVSREGYWYPILIFLLSAGWT